MGTGVQVARGAETRGGACGESGENRSRLSGGAFLVRETCILDVFTPEDFTAEQHQYANTARDFMVNEVLPHSDRIEEKDFELSLELMRAAGELGLLMADVPEEYGGLALDKTSSALIYENLSGQTSFQTLCGVHSSIGSLPIVYYGTPEQKERYVPSLATGELIGCYCLTEPAAGSDALACRTKAVLSADGTHYVLNGTKQFISNGGVADVFTVFAKVDGKDFTAFIVDRDTPGLSTGPEEHKMGLRGSSTTNVILADARVPVGNVLGEIGKGHKIAFNILNFGRLKVGGVQSTGYCKLALEASLAYCLERKQFGRRLADLGAIREKLAEMLVRTYVVESATYRTLGLIQAHIDASGNHDGAAVLAAGEQYQVECALVKVSGTEILDFVVDEAVQCFGGYGYCSEYPVERYYRDARINRIFEGTNEINRIFAASALLRLGAAGRLPLAGVETARAEGPLASEERIVATLKRLCLLAMRAAEEKHGKAIAEQQPLLTRIADLAALAYTAQSALLRAQKDVGRRGAEAAGIPVAAARIACEEAARQAERFGLDLVTALRGTPAEASLAAGLAELSARSSSDLIALRETIASRLVECERVVL
ncbi:MAG: acyl-CoA dehydrogenase family protein [Deltaproteobacteria bacterium]|nr:acyl-CoA dehydrogenase family protein [Deltaproteobacteria bacterium]